MNFAPAPSDESRLATGQILHLLLADEYMLYATTHDYQWTVAGPAFCSLHRLFADQYGLIQQWLDAIAARVRGLTVGPRGNLAELTEAVRVSTNPGLELSPARMVAVLLGQHENLADHLRTDAACTARLGDPETAGFLTSLQWQHEREAGLLRAHLKSEPALST